MPIEPSNFSTCRRNPHTIRMLTGSRQSEGDDRRFRIVEVPISAVVTSSRRVCETEKDGCRAPPTVESRRGSFLDTGDLTAGWLKNANLSSRFHNGLVDSFRMCRDVDAAVVSAFPKKAISFLRAG